MLLTTAAAAETCDQHYPGSCRTEVSTTIVTAPGNEVAEKRPRRVASAKPVHRAKQRRVSVKLPAPARVPVPRPPPEPEITSASTEDPLTARLLVDHAFNVLTASDEHGDPALQSALLNRRHEMLGFALRPAVE